MTEAHRHKHPLLKFISLVLATVFLTTTILPPRLARAQVLPTLPVPGTLLSTSQGYVPLLLKGIQVDPQNPLSFNFIMNTGELRADTDGLREEMQRQIKYFLASLTVPEAEMWVNLSPYEGDRIIPDAFGQTEMGMDLLAQDYLLKQLTASLMYPEEELGQAFWKRVYQRAEKEFGTRDIPVDTYNKVWIVPEDATVFQKDGSAYVIESSLKVMLEEDYVAKMEGRQVSRSSSVQDIDAQIIREVIIPEIEREVNEGQTFAKLRQIYQAMILATWYKINLRETLLGRIYVDRNKVAGVDTADKQLKEKIYQQYIDAFKKGVYNYIKEEQDPVSGQIIPRKYFSGGFTTDEALLTTVQGSLIDGNGGLAPYQQEQIVTSLGTFAAGSRTIAVDVNLVEDPAAKGWSQVVTAETFSRDAQGLVRADAAMLTENSKDYLRDNNPELLHNVDNGNFSPEQVEAINIMVDIGNAGILKESSNVGGLLDQVARRDKTYPTGLRGYHANAARKMKIFYEGGNPMADVIKISAPATKDLTSADSETLNVLNREGLKVVNKTVFVMPAGGLGERLGYGGLKLDLPLDSLTRKSYLQMYAENILALQERSNNLNGEDERIPLVMMTSADNHQRTLDFIQKNNLFGMDGLTVIDVTKDIAVYDAGAGKVVVADRRAYEDRNEIVNPRDIGQMVIFQQDSVFAFTGEDAKFVLQEDGLIKEKPHNHGDIELLLHLSGVAKAFEQAGKKQSLFFQDTNGEAFNAVLPGLGASVTEGYKVNLLAVERKPGDAVGAIAEMTLENGTTQVGNIEYNDVPNVAKNYGLPEENFSSGNINIFIVNQQALAAALDETNGLMPEIVNPKPDTGEARLEAMMQDIAKAVPGSQVGVTSFPVRMIFAATKNALPRALSKVEKGNFPEHLAATEGVYHMNTREMLARAGVEINPEGNTRYAFEDLLQPAFGLESEVPGIPYQDGARISLSPFFAQSVEDIQQKMKGVSISDRSFVVIEGERVFLKDVKIDGAVDIRTNPAQTLVLENLTIENAGWEFVPLTAEEVLDERGLPEDIRMRGYKLVKRDQFSVDITDQGPGVYTVDTEGNVRRADPAVLTEVLDPSEAIRLITESADPGFLEFLLDYARHDGHVEQRQIDPQILARQLRETGLADAGSGQDRAIQQGIPRLGELREARDPRGYRILSEMAGRELFADRDFQRQILSEIRQGRVTFALLKPDTIGLGEEERMLAALESADFEVIEGPHIRLSEAEAEELYQEHKGQRYFSALIDFMTGTGEYAGREQSVVPLFLKTAAQRAETAAQLFERNRNILRGIIPHYDQDLAKRENRIHGSDSINSAEREAGLIFKMFPEREGVGKPVLSSSSDVMSTSDEQGEFVALESSGIFRTSLKDGQHVLIDVTDSRYDIAKTFHVARQGGRIMIDGEIKRQYTDERDRDVMILPVIDDAAAEGPLLSIVVAQNEGDLEVTHNLSGPGSSVKIRNVDAAQLSRSESEQDQQYALELLQNRLSLLQQEVRNMEAEIKSIQTQQARFRDNSVQWNRRHNRMQDLREQLNRKRAEIAQTEQQIRRVTDQAGPVMTARQDDDRVGGIDLNSAHLNLKIERDDRGVPLPMDQQPMPELMNIDGFLPVIINVTPIQSVPMLLGLEDSPADQRQTGTESVPGEQPRARLEKAVIEAAI